LHRLILHTHFQTGHYASQRANHSKT